LHADEVGAVEFVGFIGKKISHRSNRRQSGCDG
jgi:hypothetical protein